MLRSLRLQLFLGILVILLGAGGIIMVSSKQQVEQALIDAEYRSASNVLNLIELHVSNRYRELLMEKVRIVAERRGTLQQLGAVISATMDRFDRLVFAEKLTRQEARELAFDWASQLDLGDTAIAFAINGSGSVVVHPDPAMIGHNLGATLDLKGRTIISALHEEIANYGYAFIIYDEDTVSAPEGDNRRFAYFMPVPAFGIYVGISDTIGDVERYVQTGVEDTIAMLSDTLSQVQVVDSGFVFIFDDALQPVTPPPDWAARLTDTGPAGAALLAPFRDAGARGDGEAVHYTLDVRGTPREMEAYVSHFRPLGWYIVSTMPSDEVARPAQMLLQRQIAIFAGVLAVVLLLAWVFATKITGPLQRLTAYARELPSQDFTAEGDGSPALRGLGAARSEVGGLARAFLFMDGSLRENIRALLETSRAKERIESELNIATEIQRGLLPKIFPPFPQRPEIDLHAALYPARHVGGDLFDFYFLDENRLLFTVGDVADKGVPSALFMAITKTLVKSASSQETDPARMMERVNNDLSADNPSAMFVTLFIGILDLRTGVVDYVNAGHNPPIIMSRDGAAVFQRPISGPPGGAMEHVPYRPLQMVLQPGDSLVVYTDGITEAMDEHNLEYGNDRLQEMCRRLKGNGAADIVGKIVDDVRIHSGTATQSDDITLLCLSWRGETGQTV